MDADRFKRIAELTGEEFTERDFVAGRVSAGLQADARGKHGGLLGRLFGDNR
jgi:hypothetical protein